MAPDARSDVRPEKDISTDSGIQAKTAYSLLHVCVDVWAPQRGIADHLHKPSIESVPIGFEVEYVF